MFKNQLQEVAQRSCFNLPSYACIREGPDHAPRFKAIVNFNGETFESPTFCNTLRQAEHAAAEVALSTLSKRGPSRSLAARVLDETGVYKNLLQETAHRAGLNLPVYTTIRSGPGHTPVFTCTVELAGMSFMGDPAKTKKQAQKNAAMAAWSALKQLPNMGSSSSSSSLLEAENNEEQEQVIIARALANRHSADGSKLVLNDRQHEQLKQPPVQRGKSAARRAPLYSRPRYQSLAYSNLLPEVGTYQTWHQEQFVHQQSHLLTLPALPPNDPRNFLFVQSTQPMQGQYFSTIEQDPLTSIPFYQESTSSSSLGFTSYPLHTSRSRSQVSIQEMHEEKSDMEEKELFCNGSYDAEGNHREQKPDPLSSAASSSQLEGPNLRLSVDKPSDPEYPQKDKQASDSSHLTEMPSEGEADVSNPGVKQIPINRHLSSAHSSTDGQHTQEIQQRGRNHMPPFEGMQAVPNTYDPLIRSYSNFTTQTRWAFGSTQPASAVHPPPAMISSLLPPHVIGTATGITIPVYGSGQRVDVFRPRTPLVAAPVTVRTAIPVCSARRATPNLKSCVSHAMAPAVNIRSVAPVCSSPPPTHVPVQTRYLENQGTSKTTSEFSKLHL